MSADILVSENENVSNESEHVSTESYAQVAGREELMELKSIIDILTPKQA